jgi:hypothetical protein
MRFVKRKIKKRTPIKSRWAGNQMITHKKDLVLKEYDSLFIVYTRKSTFIYSLRGLAVTLLVLYLTFLFTVKPQDFVFIPGYLIIAGIYFLETLERSDLRNLIEELRELESIFMIRNIHDFNIKISEYEFRDIRDGKKSIIKRWDKLGKSLIDPRVLPWNMVLAVSYTIIAIFIGNNYQNDLKTRFIKSKRYTSEFYIGPFSSGTTEIETNNLSGLKAFLDSTQNVTDIWICGGVDKKPLRRSALKMYGDNLTLAQSRAHYVEKLLRILPNAAKVPIYTFPCGENIISNDSPSTPDKTARSVRVILNYQIE